MAEHKYTDEIDLLGLILRSINFIRRNFWTLLMIFTIGSAIGLTYYLTANRKVYQSKMMVSSKILTKMYATKLFDNANKHINEGGYEEIASMFDMTAKSAKEITRLKIEDLIIDDPKENDKFLITAEVYSSQILPELQHGLVKYLENNDYVKVRVEQNKNYLKQMIAEVDKEIADMEKVKLRIYEGDFFQRSGNVMFDPTTVNSKILDLKKQRLEFQNTLQLINSVHVINGFTEFNSPLQQQFLGMILYGLSIGVIFVFAYLGIFTIRKLVNMADSVKR